MAVAGRDVHDEARPTVGHQPAVAADVARERFADQAFHHRPLDRCHAHDDASSAAPFSPEPARTILAPARSSICRWAGVIARSTMSAWTAEGSHRNANACRPTFVLSATTTTSSA